MTEALQWRTDVLRAYAAESRQRITNVPRQTLSFSHQFHPRQYERARAMVRSNGVDPWLVPLFHEARSFSASAGQSVVAVDTSSAQYEAGGYAALIQDEQICEFRIIDAIAADALTFTADLGNNYSCAQISPAKIGYAPGGLEAGHGAELAIPAGIEFQIFGGPDWAVTPAAPDEHQGYPVIPLACTVGERLIQERILHPADVIDNGFATPLFEMAQQQPQQTLGLAWKPANREELWAVRQLLYAVRGRQKAFWVPGYNRGLELVADISSSDTTLTVRDVGFADHQTSGELFIRLAGGDYHFLRFTSVTPAGGSEVIELDAATGFSAAAADVQALCLMSLMRLEADRVEINHLEDHRSEILLPCTEVPLP